jgi:hypothetical protein
MIVSKNTQVRKYPANTGNQISVTEFVSRSGSNYVVFLQASGNYAHR